MTLTCEKCVENIQAYLDGELDEKQKSEVLKHIESYEKCVAEYEKQVKLRSLLNELRNVEIPPANREAFIEALQEKIDSERKGLKRRLNFQPVLVFGVMVITAVFLFVAVPRGEAEHKIAPASGFTLFENSIIDAFIMGTLDDHFMSENVNFMGDPLTGAGRTVMGWRVIRNSHKEIFEPAE